MAGTLSHAGAARPGRLPPSGGLNPKEAAAGHLARWVGGASPKNLTGDIKGDGAPIAKRGRIPGLTDSPRLKP